LTVVVDTVSAAGFAISGVLEIESLGRVFKVDERSEVAEEPKSLSFIEVISEKDSIESRFSSTS